MQRCLSSSSSLDITLALCNNFRSLELFLEDYSKSANGCHPIALRCTSWSDFQLGQCQSCKDCSCRLAAMGPQIKQKEYGFNPIPNPFKTFDNFSDQYFKPQESGTEFYFATEVASPFCRELPFPFLIFG